MAEIPLRQMYMKGVTYDVSRVHARGAVDDVIEAARHAWIRPEEIISRSVPFSEAAEAMLEPDVKTVFMRDQGGS